MKGTQLAWKIPWALGPSSCYCFGVGALENDWHQELIPKAPAEPVGLILVPRCRYDCLALTSTSSSCHDLLGGDLADQLEGAKPSSCKTFFVSSHLDGSKPLTHRAKR